MRTFDPFPALSTERLALRQLTLNDAHDVFRIYADPEVVRYWGSARDQSIEEAARRIEMVNEGVRDHASIRWAITAREGGALLGSAGFWRWSKPHRFAEIGYELARAAWGKGIMSEALRAIVCFGFEEMELNRVEANVDPENVASTAVLRKLGFTQEGLLRENWFYGGKFVNTAHFGLLRREWRREGGGGGR